MSDVIVEITESPAVNVTVEEEDQTLSIALVAPPSAIEIAVPGPQGPPGPPGEGGGGGGVTDHGALTGLSDDDHPQYHNDARGDARYLQSVPAEYLTETEGDTRYVNESEHTKAAHDALDIDADTLDGIDSTGFAPIAHVGSGGTAHANAVASGAAGFLIGSDKAKLDGIESGATADQTAAEILTAVKTVDGSGSGLDADTLDGIDSAGFAATGDTRIPTQGENDALVGTSGTPSSTNKYVTDSDARNTNSRTPTAHKTSHEPGGSDALTALTDASIAAANKDGVAGTASMRTLGTGATQATAGNDSRLSDARTPTAHTHDASDVNAGTLATARLGSGTPAAGKYVDGAAGVWTTLPGAVDPIANPEWSDDFLPGLLTTGNIGEMGWDFTASTVAQVAGEANRPGILRRNVNATASQITSLHLGGVVAFLPAEMFDMTFIFRVGATNFTTAQMTHKFGLMDTTATAPTNGIYIEQTIGSANIIGRCRSASTNTDTATLGTLVADTWFKVRIRRISGTQIGFTLDAGTEAVISTGIPTAGLFPCFQYTNGNANARSYDLDMWRLKITGLTR